MTNNLPALTQADWLAIERKAYENSLYAFVKQAWDILEPDKAFIENWHIEAICLHLEAVSRGEITRLAISIPPGHMKSLIVAVFFNAWIWTFAPGKRFISTGSSETFCERDNGKLRTLIRSEWYQERWPMSFPQTDTILRFENNSLGFRWAKSFASLTGGRCGFLLMDDILPADAANSDTEREKTNRRFFETATSRLESEDDAIIIIQQRIHEQDLIGELQERQARGENLGFQFLNIPMEYDGGDPPTSIGWTDPRTKFGELICPAYRSQAWVDREKITMGVYAWSSQYLQRPIPRGNGFFDVADFKRYDTRGEFAPKGSNRLPAEVNYYLTSDHALGLSAKGDYNVFRIWGLDCDKNYWLVDSFREKCSINKALGLEMKDGRYAVAPTGAFALIRKYSPMCWFADGDNIIKAQLSTIRDAMISTGVMCRLEIVPSGQRSKIERASALQTQAQLGKVYYPDNAVGDAALAELQAFPMSSHDDQIDADSLLPRMTAHAAYITPTARNRRDDDYLALDAELDDDTPTSNCF